MPIQTHAHLDLTIHGKESIINSLESPLKARDFSLANERGTSQKQITNGLTPTGNMTFDVHSPYANSSAAAQNRQDFRSKHKHRYPISQLIESGLLVFKTEGKFFSS